MAHRNPNARPVGTQPKGGNARRGNVNAQKQAGQNLKETLEKTKDKVVESAKTINKIGTGGGSKPSTSSSNTPVSVPNVPNHKQGIVPAITAKDPQKAFQFTYNNNPHRNTEESNAFKIRQKKREEERRYRQTLEGQIDTEIEKVTTTGQNTKKYNLYSQMVNSYWNDYVYNVDPEEFKTWYDDNVIIVKRFNEETGEYEKVPTFKDTAPPPPLGTDKNGKTVDISKAWKYCQAYDVAINKYIDEQQAAIDAGTATKYAGQDDTAVDSLLDVFRAGLNPNESGTKAFKNYVRDYMWNPLVNGDFKALGINTLWNFQETLDYAGVGARSVAASQDYIGSFTRDATFKGQNEWWYDDEHHAEQNRLVSLGADKILRGTAHSKGSHTTGGDRYRVGDHESKEEIEAKIREAGLWEEYQKMKTAWGEHQQEFREDNKLLQNIKSAYTDPSANFHADTGSLVKDIGIEVLLDPTLILGGAASGFAKTSARTTSEVAARTVVKSFANTVVSKEGQNAAEKAIRTFVKNNSDNLLTKNHNQIAEDVRTLADRLEKSGAIDRSKGIVDASGHWTTFDDQLTKEIFASIDSANYKIVRSLHNASELMNKADSTAMKAVFAGPYIPISGAIKGFRGARTEISRLVNTATHRAELFGEELKGLPKHLDDALDSIAKRNQYDEIVARNQFGKIQSRARMAKQFDIGSVESHYKDMAKQPSSEVWDDADRFIQSAEDLASAMNRPMAAFRDGKITAAQFGDAIDDQITALSGVATTRSELKAYLEDLYKNAPEGDFGRMGRIYDILNSQLRQVESLEKQIMDREVRTLSKELKNIDNVQDFIEFSNRYFLHSAEKQLPEAFEEALIAKYAELGEQITPEEFDTVLRNLERNQNMSIDLNPRDADIPLPTSVKESKGFATSVPENVHGKVQELQKYFTKEQHNWEGLEKVRQYMFSISKVSDMPPKALHDVLRKGIDRLTLRKAMGGEIDDALLTKMIEVDRSLYDNALSIENYTGKNVDYNAIHLDHLTVFDEYSKHPNFQKVLETLRDPNTEIGKALNEVKHMRMSSVEYENNPVYELLKQINDLLDMNTAYSEFRNAISDDVIGLTDRQVYAVLDRLFGITKGSPKDYMNKALRAPEKFMEDLEALLVAEYGEVRCSLDGARVQIRSFDPDLFKDYADEIDLPEIRSRLEELTQPGHIDPMNDVRVQMLYTILRDKSTIKDYNALQENERAVIFSDIETSGLNKDRNGLTSIAFKKWIPIDEDASLSDILDIIESKESETLYKRSLSDAELNRIDDGLLNSLFAKDPKLANTSREDKLEAYKKFYAEDADGTTIFSSEEDMMKFINQYITDSSITVEPKKWWHRSVRRNERAVPCLVFHNANGFDTKFLTARMRNLQVGIPKGAVRHISDIEKYSHNTLARLRALEDDVILTAEQKEFVQDQLITLARKVQKYDNGFKFLDPRALEIALYDLQKLCSSEKSIAIKQSSEQLTKQSQDVGEVTLVLDGKSISVPSKYKDFTGSTQESFDKYKEFIDTISEDSKQLTEIENPEIYEARVNQAVKQLDIDKNTLKPAKVSIDKYSKDSLQTKLGVPNSDKFNADVANLLNSAELQKVRHDLQVACQDVGHMQNRYEKNIVQMIQNVNDDFVTAKTYHNLMREAQATVPDRPWSYLSYNVAFRGKEAVKYFDWTVAEKITTDELHNMKQFTDWVDDQIQYHLRAGADEIIEPYEDFFRDVIDTAMHFVRDVDQYNEYSFLRFLKQPSTSMEAYLVAQKLYDDVLKYTDTNMYDSASIKTLSEKYLAGEKVNADFTNFMRIKTMKEEGLLNDIADLDSALALDILSGKRYRSYIFNNTTADVEHYIESFQTPHQQAVAEIKDLQLHIKRRENAFAEKFSFSSSSDFKGIKNSRIQTAFDNLNEIIDVFNKVGDHDTEFWRSYVYFKKQLNSKRTEIFDAYRLNRMLRDADGNIATDEQLLSEILFTNGLRKIIPRTGNELHTKQVTELVERIQSMDSKYLIMHEEGDHIVLSINPQFKPVFSRDDDGKLIARFPDSATEYKMLEEEKIGFPDFEDIMKDYDGEIYPELEAILNSLKRVYDDIDDITDGASRGTLGITTSYNKEVRLASSFSSKTVRDTLSTDFTGDSRIWGHDSFDKSLLGDYDNSWKLNSSSDDFDMLLNAANTLDEVSGRVMSEQHYIETFFGDRSPCKINDLSKDFSNDELLEMLRDSDEFVCVTLHEANTSSGFEIKQMRINDTFSIEMAKRNGAIYIPYDLYINMTDIINNADISNKFLKLWSKFSIALKVTQLIHPGTWVRNWIDATYKIAGDEGSLGMALGYEFIAAKRLMQVQKITREAGTDVTEAMWKAANYDKYMTYDDFNDLVGFMATDSVSGGEATRSKKIIKEYFERGKRDEALGIDSFNTLGSDIQRFEQAYELDKMDSLLNQTYKDNPDLFDRMDRDDFVNLFSVRKLDNTFTFSDDATEWLYNEIAEKVIDKATKNIKHPIKTGQRGFDKIAGAMLTPMSQAELLVRYSQLLALRDLGHTNASAYKHIVDTHFNYNNKTLRMKCLETVVPFATFQLNNLFYWIKQIDQNPRMLRWIEQTFGAASFDGIDDVIDDQNGYIDQSLEYRIASGGIPLGSGGLYFKLNPSYLDALNWFYGGPDDFLSKVSPPIRSLARASIMEMGFDSYNIFSEVQFSHSAEEWMYELSESVPGANYVAGYVRHFKDTQPWNRVDMPMHKALVMAMPSLFGAVKAYDRSFTGEFEDWQAQLAEDGKWYDSQLGKVVDLSQKKYREHIGLNNPKLSWEDRRILEFLSKGRLYDQNQGKFVSQEYFIHGGLNRTWDFTKDGEWEEYCRLKKKYLGLEYDLNLRKFVKHKTPGGLNADNLDWDTICDLNEKKGVFWDANQSRFVEEKYLTKGGFNKEHMTFQEMCAYQYGVRGKVWSQSAHAFVKVTDPLVVVKAYNKYNDWRIFNNMGFNPTNIVRDNATYMKDGMLRTIDGKYVLSNNQASNDRIFQELLHSYPFSGYTRRYGYRSGWINFGHYDKVPAVPRVPDKPYRNVMSINNKPFGFTYSSSDDYAGLRMAVSGYKAYDEYYNMEFQFNYSYRNPTGFNNMIKRFDYYRPNHQPLFNKFALYSR